MEGGCHGSFGFGEVGVTGREGEVVNWVSGGWEDMEVLRERVSEEQVSQHCSSAHVRR